MKIGISLLVVNAIVSILDYMVNGELTNITGYFTLVGLAGLVTFMLGITVGCGEVNNNYE